jgi:hypothetical protein
MSNPNELDDFCMHELGNQHEILSRWHAFYVVNATTTLLCNIVYYWLTSTGNG